MFLVPKPTSAKCGNCAIRWGGGRWRKLITLRMAVPVYASLPSHHTQQDQVYYSLLRTIPTFIYVIQMITISSNAFLFPSRALLLITTILNISKPKRIQLLISRTTVWIAMSIVTQAKKLASLPF